MEQPYRFFLWLALATLAALALCMLVAVSSSEFDFSPGMRRVAAFSTAGLIAGFLLGFLGFFLALIPPLKPLFRWVVRRSAFLALCGVTLVALVYAIENFRGKRAWEHFKREAGAQGEAWEAKDVIPPPVPDDQNVVASPLFEGWRNEFDPEWRKLHTGPNGLTNEADRLKLDIGRENDPWPENESANWMISRHTDLKAWQKYYRKPAEATSTPPGIQINEFPIAPQPQTPAEDVLLALSRYDAVMAELRAVSARPQARFPIRHEDGFNMLLPHLAKLKSLSQFLRLRAAAEIEAGLTNEAAADIELALWLVDLVKEEPVLISQLVRLAQLQVTLNSLWEGLAGRCWTDAQLAGFERRLGGFDFLADYRKAMRGERTFCAVAVDHIRRLRNADALGAASDESGNDSDPAERFLGPVVLQLIPGGWFDQNNASIGRLHLEFMLPGVDCDARRVSPSNVRRLTVALDDRLKHRSPYNWFGNLLMPALSGASARFAQGQASADLARVACALERHRLAHGQYPESLDALVPAFIAKLPHDVIDGQPLRYRRTAEGSFVLYSIGWNEKDDGGTVVPNKDKRGFNWKEGDWVWQYPAK